MKSSFRFKRWLLGHDSALSLAIRAWGARLGYRVGVGEVITISRNSDRRRIVLRRSNIQYVPEVVENFDMFFGAIENHAVRDEFEVADYSTEAAHVIADWSVTDVVCPGLPEPYDTVEQYIRLTELQGGMNVLDLGAYAGLSAMAFQEVVGTNGRVCAVEADPVNFSCASRNIGEYEKVRGYAPQLIFGAAWSSDGELSFASEGSLGSGVASVIPRVTSSNAVVPCWTLSSIVRLAGLDRVDVIKADIEGAEYSAFSDRNFFAEFNPVVVFEPALDGQFETSDKALRDLFHSMGYQTSVHPQRGSRLPLIVATPPKR